MNTAPKLILAAAAALALSACANMNASMPWNSVRLAGSLSGSEEVPVVNTAGHFHGPAGVGQNAGVVVPFASPGIRSRAKPR